MEVKEGIVNLGEIVVTEDPEVVLTVPGVGSCIVVCAYHPRTKLTSMAHIVLPSSKGRNEATSKPFWFADIAVPYLLKSMVAKGAVKPNCAIVVWSKNLSTFATFRKFGIDKHRRVEHESCFGTSGRNGQSGRTNCWRKQWISRSDASFGWHAFCQGQRWANPKN